MNEAHVDAAVNVESAENRERWKTLVIILTLVNTILVAMVAGLQVDANIRANNANRDSQYYAILASGELLRQGLQVTYDMGTYARFLTHTQESLVMQFTALEQEKDGNKDAAAISVLQSAVAQAQAAKAQSFSIFMTDARYAPKSADSMPDSQAYMSDTVVKVNGLVTQQNAASDDYHQWSNKGDSYIAVLTILAIAFFLLGLGQSLNSRLRLLFAVFGAIMMIVGGAWMVLILLG
jgi:hypothetical protein